MRITRDGLLRYYWFDDFKDCFENQANVPYSIISRYRLRNVEVIDNFFIEDHDMKMFFFNLKTPDQEAFKGYAQILGVYEDPQIFRFPAFMIPYILESNWSTKEKKDLELSKPGDIVTIGGFPHELRYMIDSMDKEEMYELPLRYFRKQKD